MPSRWTFEIPPIRKLIYKYGGDFKDWIDPFAGMNSPAEITNDLNPDMPAEYHLEAKEFINKLNGQPYNGCLFDPPYNLSQLKECYEGFGLKMMKEDAQYFPSNIQRLIAPKIKTGGIIITCGWSSQGFGKENGFKKLEILLVCHGRHHYDTIVTVEQKFQDKLF